MSGKDGAKKMETPAAAKSGEAMTEAEKEAAASLEKAAHEDADHPKGTAAEGEKATEEKPADVFKEALKKKAQEKAATGNK